MNQPKVTFDAFIEAFPAATLPMVLTEESIHHFNKANQPFPALMVDQYLSPLEGLESLDEFTEFIPCFRIEDITDFIAVVYYKAALLNHQYVLATFTKKAEVIDKKVIAGTFSDNQTLINSVATINEDWEIIIVSGTQPANEPYRFDPTKSTSQQLEILPVGKIVNHD
ncbi:MAG: hypothetical protein AAF705_01040 [Bacteroidota bacterium]